MILYKYLPPDRPADLLQHQRIRFTQPDGFNDPFESRPCFDSVVERSIVEQICQLDDPEETKKWQAEIMKLVQGPDLKDWYTSRTLNNVGILCLTESYDNILMWAHYTRSHQGFVVGLDMEHPSLKNRKDGAVRNCQRVLYTSDRPKRETLTDLTVEEAFYTKSPDWAHEREWRIFDSVFHADHELTVDGQRVFLFRFDPRAVHEVILGTRMPKDSVNALLEALKRPDYQHVRLKRAELHQDQFRVDVRDIPLP